ncbi:MAG: hypothetical protein VYA97_14290 [Pseudomonadota bacterium]|nr:hypothetical protein [Pseudomonadota bacterium]
MLTDIFAFRYASTPLWNAFTQREQRLLVQTFSILGEKICRYYYHDGKVSPEGKAFWENLHNRVAVELGLKSLSSTGYSYMQTYAGKQTSVTGLWPIITVCENWIHEQPRTLSDADTFVKERLSLVEVAFRLREEKVAEANAALPDQIQRSKNLPKTGLRIPGDPEVGLRARNKSLNENFQSAVDELNTRFRQAGCKIHYHNGFIQLSEDEFFLQQAEQPFWKLVSDPVWKNVDIDMKEAIDRRDGGERDPAWYAVRALESTIKIISDSKGFSHGGERGAHHYVDNLSKKAANYIERWEAEALKAIFSDLRNPFGHGPGSAEMPSLTSQQTDYAIEVSISWIKSLIKRY